MTTSQNYITSLRLCSFRFQTQFLKWIDFHYSYPLSCSIWIWLIFDYVSYPTWTPVFFVTSSATTIQKYMRCERAWRGKKLTMKSVRMPDFYGSVSSTSNKAVVISILQLGRIQNYLSRPRPHLSVFKRKRSCFAPDTAIVYTTTPKTITENGVIRKRSPEWSDLKTMLFENAVS